MNKRMTTTVTGLPEFTKLNLGCGDDVRDGWLNLDRRFWDGTPDGCMGWDLVEDGPLPFAAQTFEIVVANHVLHMIDVAHLPEVLSEIFRVLAPDGAVRVLEADPIRAFRAWERNDRAWFPIADEIEPDIDGKLARYLTWHGTRKTLLPEGLLARLLTEAGFVHCTLSPFGRCELDSREDESIIMQAYKP